MVASALLILCLIGLTTSAAKKAATTQSPLPGPSAPLSTASPSTSSGITSSPSASPIYYPPGTSASPSIASSSRSASPSTSPSVHPSASPIDYPRYPTPEPSTPSPISSWTRNPTLHPTLRPSSWTRFPNPYPVWTSYPTPCPTAYPTPFKQCYRKAEATYTSTGYHNVDCSFEVYSSQLRFTYFDVSNDSSLWIWRGPPTGEPILELTGSRTPFYVYNSYYYDYFTLRWKAGSAGDIAGEWIFTAATPYPTPYPQYPTYYPTPYPIYTYSPTSDPTYYYPTRYPTYYYPTYPTPSPVYTSYPTPYPIYYYPTPYPTYTYSPTHAPTHNPALHPTWHCYSIEAVSSTQALYTLRNINGIRCTFTVSVATLHFLYFDISEDDHLYIWKGSTATGSPDWYFKAYNFESIIRSDLDAFTLNYYTWGERTRIHKGIKFAVFQTEKHHQGGDGSDDSKSSSTQPSSTFWTIFGLVVGALVAVIVSLAVLVCFKRRLLRGFISVASDEQDPGLQNPGLQALEMSAPPQRRDQCESASAMNNNRMLNSNEEAEGDGEDADALLDARAMTNADSSSEYVAVASSVIDDEDVHHDDVKVHGDGNGLDDDATTRIISESTPPPV